MKREEREAVVVGVIGNPNCGKTTLFNALTGASAKVANWPGVTVERMEGEREYGGKRLKIVDLPGIYSLDSYSMEEQVAKKWLEEEKADVIVNVADGTNLEKSLYLTFQLLEKKLPVILALNMMDAAKKQGIKIDVERLSGRLNGASVVPVSARKGTGLSLLLEEILSRAGGPEKREKETGRTLFENREALIKGTVDACVSGGEKRHLHTERADRLLTHRIWGLPCFFVILAAVFFLTFTIGDFLKGFLETGLSWLLKKTVYVLLQMEAAEWLVSLVSDGILSGVGSVLVFLPNIACLFFALAILEDSGYMARAAYVMDDIMEEAGLSGKAFLPMILGFGCSVPAVMATRTLEHERDRKRTILVIPFMSCSARMPVYILFSSAFFGKRAALAAYSLYVIGTVTALFVACTVNRFAPGKKSPLIMELPDYKMPDVRTVFLYVKEKLREYLTKAGTTIFLASVFLWFLLHFGQSGMVSEASESFGAGIGRTLVPVLAPAGLGMWQLAVALICGLSAKEMIVSGCSVLFGIDNINSAGGIKTFSELLSLKGFGPLHAYTFMVFCLLYTPCAAAIAVIRRETRSTVWTAGLMAFQLLFAWGVSVLLFQMGSFFLGQ